MPFLKKLKNQFEYVIRSRGELYFRQGRVRITKGSFAHASASVRGTRRYRVELSAGLDGLHADCNCPYAEHSLCKHIWATLMAAESAQLLGILENSSRIPIEKGPPDEEDGFEYENPDDVEDSRGIHQNGSPGFETPDSGSRPPAVNLPIKSKPVKSSWKDLFRTIQNTAHDRIGFTGWPRSRELIYEINLDATRNDGRLRVDVFHRDRKSNGDWYVKRKLGLKAGHVRLLPDPLDRKILGILFGTRNPFSEFRPGFYSRDLEPHHRFSLTGPMIEIVMPLLTSSGRVFMAGGQDSESGKALKWDGGLPWTFRLGIRQEKKNTYRPEAHLFRDGAELPLTAPAVLLQSGWMFHDGMVAKFEHHGCFPWIVALRHNAPVDIPVSEIREFLTAFYRNPDTPELVLPDAIRPEEISDAPAFKLFFRRQKSDDDYYFNPSRLYARLSFDYAGTDVSADPSQSISYDKRSNRLIRRDEKLEGAAAESLLLLGFKKKQINEGLWFEILPKKMPAAVKTLVADGWRVEAAGKIYRQAGQIRIEVRSGIDWFELDGFIEFGDSKASFPELLSALRRKENVVLLDDGTLGIIPEEWLERYGPLADFGRSGDSALRFARNQAGLLDALLSTQENVVWDEIFEEARRKLRSFEGIAPADAPEGFSGELRPYQREGLGWLHFLRDFEFGGCLADDMGLGKTVQVLALLESRRRLREAPTDQPGEETPGRRPKRTAEKTGRRLQAGEKIPAVPPPPPSLVVAPRSLVFNWKQEAQRFTPRMKIIDHTGMDRSGSSGRFDDCDLVITTYGTMRRDILMLKDFRFDYVILDEAQAIKNASSGSAKAARLLSADHRLALSGTPIENHLGELWSLFEFLNPGLPGSSILFKQGGLSGRELTFEGRELLSRAMRPYILRRTKKQVAPELPEKVEQTLFCELEYEQRRIYDELKGYYRRSLLERVEADGIQKSKFFVLEALLRLRQAACHPGMLDEKHKRYPSAKLEALLPQIAEVLEEGHKILVFSQFTSFLAIVRERLDEQGLSYLYLDGKTRDRGALIECFQNDPDSSLFLISLKAGGLGLNLTAAEYVYLLDPWWNPAVETQAIDRTHRIGQTRRVFAYRLIAKDTVEEKVLELQKEKRKLADAILEQDESLLRTLGREDLELLLS